MRTRNNDKEQLVREQAIQMLVREGVEGFGMNRLASACGISVATLYIYYKDKVDLIKKIGLDIGARFLAATLRGFSPDMSFPVGLKKQWENRASFALKNAKEVACYVIIMHSSHGEAVLKGGLREFRSVMHEFFQNAIKRGELIPVPVNVFWSVAYGPLYTLLQFHNEKRSIEGRPFKFTKKTMDDTFQLVIKALTP
jgi:AcrR family transcriptional regulator